MTLVRRSGVVSMSEHVTEEIREDISAALGPLMEEDVETLRLEDLEHAMEAMDAVRSRGVSTDNGLLVKAAEHVKGQVREELVRRQRERHERDDEDGRQR